MSDALTREQVETYTLSMERGRRDELLIHDATLRQRCEAAEQQLATVTQERDRLLDNPLDRHILAVRDARIAELEERLEIGFAFDRDGKRVEVPKTGPDGIDCRDETIRLQDEAVDGLRQQLTDAQATSARLREALDELKKYVRYSTLEIQKHHSLTDEQKDRLFQYGYRLYVKYNVENIDADHFHKIKEDI